MGTLAVTGLDSDQVEAIAINSTGYVGDSGTTYDGTTLIVPSATDTALADTWLSMVRADKAAEMKQAFVAATLSGYTCTNGITFDTDITDIQRLRLGHELATTLAQTTLDIRDYGNVVHAAVPLADVWTMLQELGVNYQTLLAQKWTRETTLAAATTVAEVTAIQW